MTWPTKKLGEVAIVESGGTPRRSNPNYFRGKIPFVKIRDMLSDPISNTEETITEAGLENSAAKLWQSGTLLFSIFATLGRVSELGIDAVSNQAIAGIFNIDKKIVEPKYLKHFLYKIGPILALRGRGVAQNNINLTILKRLEIPLPPLKIQKQIVERLDKIAEAQKLNDELIQKANELFQSLLHKELNPAGKNWEVKKLSEIGDIITGTTPSTKNTDYWNGEFLWATPTDITNDVVVLTDTARKLSKAGYEKTRPVLKNSVLITCIASIGKMALAGEEMATNQQINSIICKEESDPFFVFFSLQKNKKKLIQLGKTTAVPIINKSEFGRIKISLPPLKTQKQIVEKLSAVQDYKNQLLAQKSKLKELFDSVLAKSMSSELVK